MIIALVTICHPTDPDAEVPFIGCRGRIENIALESWKVKSLIDQGYDVQIHAEPYDPVAAHNAAVEQARADIAVNQPAEEPAADVPSEESVTEQPATDAPSEKDATEEDPEITPEELAEIRARVEGLASMPEAKQLLVDLGIELNPAPTKLKDVKTQLLAMLDAA